MKKAEIKNIAELGRAIWAGLINKEPVIIRPKNYHHELDIHLSIGMIEVKQNHFSLDENAIIRSGIMKFSEDLTGELVEFDFSYGVDFMQFCNKKQKSVIQIGDDLFLGNEGMICVSGNQLILNIEGKGGENDIYYEIDIDLDNWDILI